MLIQRMRDGSEGILAKIIIGLIVIVFALFGFGSITTFLAPVAKVATVNGEEIPQQEMEIAVERNRRMMLGQGVAQQDIDEDSLRSQVLEDLVNRELLSQAAEDFGLQFSDAAIDQEVLSEEAFMIDGVFNPDQFRQILSGAGYTPLSYRDELRTDKKFEQLLSGIVQTAFLTTAEAERYASLLSQTRDVAYLKLEAGKLVEEVVVSDDEIETYYQDNRVDFVTDETVSLAYIELKHQDLADGLDVADEDLEGYLQDNIGFYSVDETRQLAHILFEVGDDEAAAKAEADAVYERIKAGEDFVELARTESDDLGSANTGGDLGMNAQGTFAPEFEAVAYDLNLNQVSPPVKTEFGYHIIKVLDINEGFIPSLADVREEVERAYRLEATEEDFISLTAEMEELLFESADLEIPAESLGLEIKTTGPLARDGQDGLMANADVKDAAFSADVLLDGNNSDLIVMADSHHIGLRVIEHQPTENKPIETVTEDIRYILQRDKARDLADSRATEIVERIESGSLAQFVADEFGLEWQLLPNTPRQNPQADPFALAEAFSLARPAEGRETLGWSSIPNGDAVVVRVSKVTNTPVEELEPTEADSIRRILSGQLGSADFQEFRASLRQQADIVGINLSGQ